MPKRYRKKPVVIEAGHFDRLDKGPRIAEWCGGTFDDSSINIETLEGKMTAPLGWYVIKGVRGEFYACEPEIFNETYELVTSDNENNTDSGGVSDRQVQLRDLLP